jgi:hypothetical protein
MILVTYILNTLHTTESKIIHHCMHWSPKLDKIYLTKWYKSNEIKSHLVNHYLSRKPILQLDDG